MKRSFPLTRPPPPTWRVTGYELELPLHGLGDDVGQVAAVVPGGALDEYLHRGLGRVRITGDFEPEKYEDDYQIQLKELIEAKAAGGEAFTVEEREEASDDDGDDGVADLLAALRASVKDRGGDADSSDDDDDEGSGSGKKSSPRKSSSSSAKKAPAKNTAAKKAPPKKSA